MTFTNFNLFSPSPYFSKWDKEVMRGRPVTNYRAEYQETTVYPYQKGKKVRIVTKPKVVFREGNLRHTFTDNEAVHAKNILENSNVGPANLKRFITDYPKEFERQSQKIKLPFNVLG